MRTWWRWARPLGGAAVLGVLVWRLGTGPFVEAASETSPTALLGALLLTAGSTLCGAWRWRLVAGRLGLDLRLRDAVAGYYRSQFLNSTLPGGVLGDVHRALRHGREAGSVGRGVSAVAWERTFGQMVFVSLTLLLLLAVPSTVRGPLPGLVRLVALGCLAGGLLLAVLARGSRLASRAARAAMADLRMMLNTRRLLPAVVLTSLLAAAAHVAVFLLAADAAGTTASLGALLPLALLVLLASGLPINVAGWGPREGVAAWAFAMAGLGAAQGVTVAATYGLMALVATLPGAVVLLTGRRTASDSGSGPAVSPPAARPVLEGAGRE